MSSRRLLVLASAVLSVVMATKAWKKKRSISIQNSVPKKASKHKLNSKQNMSSTPRKISIPKNNIVQKKTISPKKRSTTKRNSNRKTKRLWIQPVLRDRSTGGFYTTLRSQLGLQDPEWFKNFLRLNLEDFDDLVERVSPYIRKKNTCLRQAISVGERLAVTLRYLATGDSFAKLMSVFLIGKATICNIIHETCAAIVEALKEEFFKVPNTAQEWEEIAVKFEDQWNFPNCCGALAGKHVMTQAIKSNGSGFLKSIVLVALVDADYKFSFLDVGEYGRESDECVFDRCSLLTALANDTLNFPPPKPLPHEEYPTPFVIVTDDNFPLEPYLMKPYTHCVQSKSQQIFNYRLSRATNVVENAFGVIAMRFKVLSKGMEILPKNAKSIVLAVCVLHNFLITRSSIYLSRTDVDYEVDGEIEAGNWRLELGQSGMFPSIKPSNTEDHAMYDAENVRTFFMDYFMSAHGELPAQDDAINF